jgi:hypothetical protein
MERRKSSFFFSGFYDGSVAVYNIADDKKRPKYQSTARTGKHTDPVWQVRRRFFLKNKKILVIYFL